jgi:hypothetical protein
VLNTILLTLSDSLHPQNKRWLKGSLKLEKNETIVPSKKMLMEFLYGAKSPNAEMLNIKRSLSLTFQTMLLACPSPLSRVHLIFNIVHCVLRLRYSLRLNIWTTGMMEGGREKLAKRTPPQMM